MFALLLLACAPAPEPTGPESLGGALGNATVLADPGDRAVEFLTWALPSEGTTTGITFVMRVPDGDAIGNVQWIPDASWTREDASILPARTQVQNTVDLCWLVGGDDEIVVPNKDEKQEVWANTTALPDSLGEVAFNNFRQEGGTVTLTCDIAKDATALVIGVGPSDISNHGDLTRDGLQWYDTYNNGHWSEPDRRVIVQ